MKKTIDEYRKFLFYLTLSFKITSSTCSPPPPPPFI